MKFDDFLEKELDEFFESNEHDNYLECMYNFATTIRLCSENKDVSKESKQKIDDALEKLQEAKNNIREYLSRVIKTTKEKTDNGEFKKFKITFSLFSK